MTDAPGHDGRTGAWQALRRMMNAPAYDRCSAAWRTFRGMRGAQAGTGWPAASRAFEGLGAAPRRKRGSATADLETAGPAAAGREER